MCESVCNSMELIRDVNFVEKSQHSVGKVFKCGIPLRRDIAACFLRPIIWFNARARLRSSGKFNRTSCDTANALCSRTEIMSWILRRVNYGERTREHTQLIERIYPSCAARRLIKSDKCPSPRSDTRNTWDWICRLVSISVFSVAGGSSVARTFDNWSIKDYLKLRGINIDV